VGFEVTQQSAIDDPCTAAGISVRPFWIGVSRGRIRDVDPQNSVNDDGFRSSEMALKN
jgi:hypothetical protein